MRIGGNAIRRSRLWIIRLGSSGCRPQDIEPGLSADRHIKWATYGRTNRQMTNDDIAHLRLLADWHGRQARYLLLAVPAGQHDQGRFHSMAAARLSRLADEAGVVLAQHSPSFTGIN